MKTLLCLLCLLFALPVQAQQSLENDIKLERAKFGVTLSPAQVSSLLNAVAWRHRGEGWGLLSKPSGASVPLGSAKIAGDILFHLPSGYIFDCLVDWEGTARPTWSDPGPMDPSRFIAAVDPLEGPGEPGQPQQPTTGITLDQLRAVLREELAWSVNPGGPEWERSEVRFTSVQEAAAANQSAILGRFQDLEAAINEPGWFKKVINSPLVKYVAPAIATGLIQRYWHVFGGGSDPQPSN